jgi:hypothetical protein
VVLRVQSLPMRAAVMASQASLAVRFLESENCISDETVVINCGPLDVVGLGEGRPPAAGTDVPDNGLDPIVTMVPVRRHVHACLGCRCRRGHGRCARPRPEHRRRRSRLPPRRPWGCAAAHCATCSRVASLASLSSMSLSSSAETELSVLLARRALSSAAAAAASSTIASLAAVAAVSAVARSRSSAAATSASCRCCALKAIER